MNDTIIALTGYILWTLLLLASLAGYRTYMAMTKQHKSLRFKSDGSDVPSFGYRLTRAHMNCVESFSFIGGLMLLAIATDAMAITNSLALVLLAARIGQSVMHLISISTLFIQIRFALFLVQFGICVYWAIQLLQRFSM